MGRNHYGTTTGKKFRLSVCLKRFFSDERARCYITADSGLHFRWLSARMRRLFELRGPFCLLSRGHLLPPDEPLGLLGPDDLVEVVPKPYKLFPDTSESEESEILNLFESDDEKAKNTVPVPVVDPPKQATEVDQHNYEKTSDEIDACHRNNEAAPELSSTENKGVQEVKIDNLQNQDNRNSKDSLELEEKDNEKLEAVKRKALELLDQCSAPPKRKRKRVRRRKPCTAVKESEEDTTYTEDVNDGPDRPSLSDSHSVTAGGSDVGERSPAPQHADTLIVRNSSEHRHTARLVHSVS